MPWQGTSASDLAAKSQLTFRYDETGKPIGIDAVVLSTQHSPDVDQATLREAVMEEIIKPILPPNWVTPDTQFHMHCVGGLLGSRGKRQARAWGSRQSNP